MMSDSSAVCTTGGPPPGSSGHDRPVVREAGAVAQLSVDHAGPYPVDRVRPPVLTAADGRRLVPILTYHSVSDDPPEPIRRWSVTPARLRAHLTALRHTGFTGLTVTGLLACYRGERELPERPVVLTFDDGYEDFLLEALPVLDDAGFPSTLYASSGLLRDERSAADRPGRMLDWRQLGEVARARASRSGPTATRIASWTSCRAARRPGRSRTRGSGCVTSSGCRSARSPTPTATRTGTSGRPSGRRGTTRRVG